MNKAVEGIPLRDHLIQSAKHDLGALDELALPPFPEELSLVWSKFQTLSNSRRVGEFGPDNISYSDMYYWSKITGWNLSAWEVEVIRRLDNAWLKQ